MNHQSITNFRNTLDQFVNINISAETKYAHKQLELAIEEFTKTKQCWETILQILNSETNNNVLLLASNIIKNKLQYDFSQLTPALFENVHQSILSIITKHNKPSNSLRINLSISIAIIYIHKAKQLGHLLEYLAKSFGQGQNRNYVFTVLEVLPEEIDNDKLVVQQDQRISLRKYMEQIQKNVLVQLNNISRSTWESKQIKHITLIKCFSNWIRLGQNLQILSGIHQHFLLQQSFIGLSDTDISEQCCISIQYVIRTINNPKQFTQLYSYLARQIIGFFPKIKKLIDDEIFELCEPFVKSLCIFGICSKQQFITNPNNDYKQFIHSVVKLTSQTELQCQVFFNQFWQQFLASLTENDLASQFYKDILKELYLIISQNLKLDLNDIKELNQKSASQLEKVNKQFEYKIGFRMQSKAIFNLLSYILSPQECLIISINAINQLKPTETNFWPTTQCYLNPLEQVIQQLSSPSQMLNNLLNKLVEINSPYKVVQKTIIRLLSSCSNVYTKNNEFAFKIFNYLTQYMKNPDMIQISSKAFENLCTYNTEFVLSHIESFVQTLSLYKDNQKILNGVIKAMQTNPKVLEQYLPKIFELYEQDLLQASSINSAKQALQKFVFIFNKLTTQNISQYQQTISKGFLSLWKMMKPILQKNNQSVEDQNLSEKCTKVIKYAMRCLKQYFQPFIQEIYNTIIESYRKYPLGSYVYMVQVFVTVYYDNTTFFQYINNLFDRICEISFTHLQTMDKIQSNPKLAEDFFGLISRVLRFIPQTVYNSKYFTNLLNFIVQCSGIEDGLIAKIFYNMLVDFYRQYWSPELVEQYKQIEKLRDKIITNKTPEIISILENVKPIIIEKSLPIIQKMIEHLEKAPSTTVRRCIAQSLMAQIKAFSNQNKDIWVQVLNPIKQDILTPKQKIKIIQSITVLNKDNLDYIDDMLELMTKRYVHKLIRFPIS